MPEITLVRNEESGILIRKLTFDVSPEGYEIPGQFVTATVGDLKPGFFAIASSPGENLVLLIKQAGETAEALTALEPGASVTVSAAMGKGFAIERTAGRELVILVNGSGISAVRPVIEAEIAGGLTRPVHFFYGVLSLAHRSFADDLERWQEAGVVIHTCVSQPDGSGTEGFVQYRAKDEGLVRADVSVILVGVRPMCEEAKAFYAAAGCPEDQVLLNF